MASAGRVSMGCVSGRAAVLIQNPQAAPILLPTDDTLACDSGHLRGTQDAGRRTQDAERRTQNAPRAVGARVASPALQRGVEIQFKGESRRDDGPHLPEHIS